MKGPRDLIDSWFVMLVGLLPRAFRTEYGDDLLIALQDWRSDGRRGKWPPIVLASTWFMARTAVLERLSPTVSRSTLPEPRASQGPLDVVTQDLKYAFRSLVKRPGFMAVGLLTLAVGVGANTAIFSVVHAVVLKPLPYLNSDSLVQIARMDVARPGIRSSMSQIDMEDLEDSVALLENLVGYDGTSLTLTGEGAPEVIEAGAVTGGILRTFGLTPLRGRDLTSSDNDPNGPRIVVISAAMAGTHLEGVDSAVGRSLRLDGKSFEVVGVAPDGFDFPEGAKLWTPLYNDTEGCARGCRYLTGVGRRASDASLGEVNSELELVSGRLERDYPETNLDSAFRAEGLQEGLLGETRRGLLMLLGAVGLVLLVAAANLASLQIARGSERRQELRLRTALGASRARLAQLLMLETFLLGLGGALLGALLGLGASRALVALAPVAVPRLDEAGLSLPVLAFALVTSVGASALFSLLPAWRMSAGGLTGNRVIGHGDSRARNVLMTGEVAMALMLLVAAGLMLKTYDRVLRVDPGFQTEETYGFFVSLPEGTYEEPESSVAFFDQVEAELASLPGVESVGSILGRPFGVANMGTTLRLMDEPEPPPGQRQSTRFRAVTPGYLKTMGVPLKDGRGVEPSDLRSGVAIALVNETFVDRYSPDLDIIGRSIDLNIGLGYDEEPVRTIVGVVGDTKSNALTRDVRPEVYVPQAQMAASFMSVVLRGSGTPPWEAVAAAVARVDPNVPLRRKETLTQAIDRARGPSRFYFALLSGFAAIAVLLAAFGLYGVVSYLVNQRTREIAIRRALGASSSQVVSGFLQQGLRTVALGLALGVGAAAATVRLLETFLFEVEPYDPWVYIGTCVALTAVSLVAMLAPAFRAGRVPPAEALNAE